MANKTIYSCDRCKKEVPEYSELLRIQIEANAHWPTTLNGQYKQHLIFDLCQECAVKLGVVVDSPKNENMQEPKKELSAAEKMVEAIEQLISERIPG